MELYSLLCPQLGPMFLLHPPKAPSVVSLMYMPSNQFLFVFHFTFDLFLGTSRSSTPAIFASDPATCPIIPGCETTIEISKGRTGLGLSIVGGSDTLLVRTQPEMLQRHRQPLQWALRGYCQGDFHQFY